MYQAICDVSGASSSAVPVGDWVCDACDGGVCVVRATYRPRSSIHILCTERTMMSDRVVYKSETESRVVVGCKSRNLTRTKRVNLANQKGDQDYLRTLSSCSSPCVL